MTQSDVSAWFDCCRLNETNSVAHFYESSRHGKCFIIMLTEIMI
jgi:hypothetical protein